MAKCEIHFNVIEAAVIPSLALKLKTKKRRIPYLLLSYSLRLLALLCLSLTATKKSYACIYNESIRILHFSKKFPLLNP